MARPKKVETDTTSIVEEKNTTVEVDTPVVEEPVKNDVQEPAENKNPVKGNKKPEKTETEDKPVKFDDNEKVVIKCIALAGKKLSLPTRCVDFDDKGNCEVTGSEANRLLSIPGYELAE